MNYRIRITALLALAITALTNCYYDNEEDLYGDQDCPSVEVTYNSIIKPMIANRCYDCHSASQHVARGGDINLEGYTNLKVWAPNPKFIGSLRHESGFEAMPKDAPKLTDCNISYIEQWIKDGAPNN
jgi:hypothetical protein